MCCQHLVRPEKIIHRPKLDPTNRCPFSLHRRIHRLREPMVSTMPTHAPRKSFAFVCPCTLDWILKPALLALILLPTFETYPRLGPRPRPPWPIQNGHQPSADPAVFVVAVDLVRRTPHILEYNIIQVTVVGFQFFRRGVKDAFNL